MTLDEAKAALAANPAAGYFAGKDLDQILATITTKPRPSDFGVPTRAELDFASDMGAVKTFREALVGANPAKTLMLTTSAIATFGGLLAARAQERAEEAASHARGQAEHRAAIAERNRRAAIAEAAWRGAHPIFASLKARITAAETAVSTATSAADFAAAEKILADAFAAALTGIAIVLPHTNHA